MTAPLITRLWLAWGPDGWSEDPEEIIASEPILNTLSDTISLVESAQRRARKLGVPDWREPWFDATIRLLDAAFDARVAP